MMRGMVVVAALASVWAGVPPCLQAFSSPEPAWSSYLGGSRGDGEGYGVVRDSAGNVYVAGRTGSDGWASGGWWIEQGGQRFASMPFLVKLAPGGEHVWSTYIGTRGPMSGLGLDVALDPEENVIVVGRTASPGWTSGGWNTEYRYSQLASFAVKLSPDGEHLWSTYLRGEMAGDEAAHGVAVDGEGNVIIVGRTESTDWTSGGWITEWSHGWGGYAVKLGPDGQHLWSTYLGEPGNTTSRTVAYAVATDGIGNVFVAGNSYDQDWLPDDAPNAGPLSGGGGFLLKLSPGGEYLWSTRVGEHGKAGLRGLTTTPDGGVVVTGFTESDKLIPGAWIEEPVYSTRASGFAVKLTTDGEHAWSTYLGPCQPGSGSHAVTVDEAGNLFVTGFGSSTSWELSNGWLTDPSEFILSRGYVVKFDPDGGHLWSSYVLPDASHAIFGVSVGSGLLYIVGETRESAAVEGGWMTEFPPAPDPLGREAFVMKVTGIGPGPSWVLY